MIHRGDFVLCNFPFRESDGPGPSPHIVLCAATGREGNTKFAIVFYTTSQIEYPGVRRPRQYLFVNENRAKELRQKRAFQVDASRIARLPLTKEYFPELSHDVLPTAGRDPDLVTKGRRKTGGPYRRRLPNQESRPRRPQTEIAFERAG